MKHLLDLHLALLYFLESAYEAFAGSSSGFVFLLVLMKRLMDLHLSWFCCLVGLVKLLLDLHLALLYFLESAYEAFAGSSSGFVFLLVLMKCLMDLHLVLFSCECL